VRGEPVNAGGARGLEERKKGFSIVRKLSFSLTVVLAIVSAIASLAVLLNEVGKTRADFEDKANNSIRYIGSILEIPLWDLDDATIAIIGEAFFQDENVASLKILGINEKVYFNRQRAAVSDVVRSVGVMHDAKLIGRAELALTYKYANDRVFNFLMKMLLAFLAIMLTTFFLTGYLIRVNIRNPLDYLTSIVSAYAAGDYSAKTGGIPFLEFKVFGEVLENMAARILASSLEKDELIREISASEAKFKSIFDFSPAAMVITDLETERILDINASLIRLLGFDGSEQLGSDSTDKGLYANPADRAGIMAAVAAGEAVRDREVLFRAKDSHLIPTRFSARPIDLAGRPCMLSLVIDITERKENEVRLNDSLKEKDALLRELYHRTKNNMQVICSMLSIKSDQMEDERSRGVLEDISNHIYSMALVHEKLYQSPNLSSISMRDYLQDLIDLLLRSQAAFSRSIDFELDLAEVYVSIEVAIPIGLIVTELVTNSLRHAFPGRKSGRIRLRLSSDQGAIALEVADDGVGFPGGFDWRSAGSMGLKTIDALGGQINASVEFESRDGVVCRLVFREPVKARI
jgi:PAS domain S-box-containing protein